MVGRKAKKAPTKDEALTNAETIEKTENQEDAGPPSKRGKGRGKKPKTEDLLSGPTENEDATGTEILESVCDETFVLESNAAKDEASTVQAKEDKEVKPKAKKGRKADMAAPVEEMVVEQTATGRARRPRQVKTAVTLDSNENVPAERKKPRGRGKKQATEAPMNGSGDKAEQPDEEEAKKSEDEEMDHPAEPKKGRGRKKQDAPSEIATEPEKKPAARGRGAKAAAKTDDPASKVSGKAKSKKADQTSEEEAVANGKTARVALEHCTS